MEYRDWNRTKSTQVVGGTDLTDFQYEWEKLSVSTSFESTIWVIWPGGTCCLFTFEIHKDFLIITVLVWLFPPVTLDFFYSPENKNNFLKKRHVTRELKYQTCPRLVTIPNEVFMGCIENTLNPDDIPTLKCSKAKKNTKYSKKFEIACRKCRALKW